MFPWIVVLAVLGLVMIFAEILMPGFGLFGILGTISLFGSLALTFKIYGLILFLIMLVVPLAWQRLTGRWLMSVRRVILLTETKRCRLCKSRGKL